MIMVHACTNYDHSTFMQGVRGAQPPSIVLQGVWGAQPPGIAWGAGGAAPGIAGGFGGLPGSQ